jgi:sensor histidine kinase YesM
MRKKTTLTALYEIFLLALAVLLIRVLYVEVFLRFQEEYGFSLRYLLSIVFSNYLVVFLMLVADFFIVRLLNKYFDYGKNPIIRFAIELLTTGLLAVVMAICLNFSSLLMEKQTLPFLPTAFGVFLINAAVIAVIDIIAYNRKLHKKALDNEILKKQKARHQYSQLKQQLNPHFLFNSLNVLDYLVHTDADKASDFIRKLAGVYRYLLNKENDMLVTLKEELDFAMLYTDLLKERFDKGLDISISIPEECLIKKIIPCGLQLLLENATKHNIINPDTPLHIAISIEENNIVVRNNIQLRLHPVESTGLGLKNIAGQYKTAFRKNINASKTESCFVVQIPLID